MSSPRVGTASPYSTASSRSPAVSGFNPQNRQDVSAFALTYILRLRVWSETFRAISTSCGEGSRDIRVQKRMKAQQFQRVHQTDPPVSDSNDSERSRPDTQPHLGKIWTERGSATKHGTALFGLTIVAALFAATCLVCRTFRLRRRGLLPHRGGWNGRHLRVHALLDGELPPRADILGGPLYARYSARSCHSANNRFPRAPAVPLALFSRAEPQKEGAVTLSALRTFPELPPTFTAEARA